MITELFGCPGAGKTYTLNMLSEGKGYKNTKPTGNLKDKLKTIIKNLLIISPCAIKVRGCMLSQIDISVYKSNFNNVSIKAQIRNISMLASVYKYFRKELYIDEGLVHRTISMCVSYEIPKEKMKDMLCAISKNFKNVKPYFLTTSIDVCYDSIIVRDRHEACIDFMSEQELLKLLHKYYEYCSYVADEFGYERIDRDRLGEKII